MFDGIILPIVSLMFFRFPRPEYHVDHTHRNDPLTDTYLGLVNRVVMQTDRPIANLQTCPKGTNELYESRNPLLWSDLFLSKHLKTYTVQKGPDIAADPEQTKQKKAGGGGHDDHGSRPFDRLRFTYGVKGANPTGSNIRIENLCHGDHHYAKGNRRQGTSCHR